MLLQSDFVFPSLSLLPFLLSTPFNISFIVYFSRNHLYVQQFTDEYIIIPFCSPFTGNRLKHSSSTRNPVLIWISSFYSFWQIFTEKPNEAFFKVVERQLWIRQTRSLSCLHFIPYFLSNTKVCSFYLFITVCISSFFLLSSCYCPQLICHRLLQERRILSSLPVQSCPSSPLSSILLPEISQISPNVSCLINTHHRNIPHKVLCIITQMFTQPLPFARSLFLNPLDTQQGWYSAHSVSCRCVLHFCAFAQLVPPSWPVTVYFVSPQHFYPVSLSLKITFFFWSL